MIEKINFVNLIKEILGEDEYLQLLKDITIENLDKDISFENFFDEITNKYCFIILLIGFSKKVDISSYNISKYKSIIKIESDIFASKYKKYIKLVEDKKFEILKDMV